MAISDRLPGSLDRTKLPRAERVRGELTLWGAYAQQRRDARHRSIDFLLSFDQWLDIWEASGRLAERGRLYGQFVMARLGDVGSYSVDNVEIITSGQNHKDGNIGKPRPKSLEHRRKLGLAHLGKALTEEHRKKIGDGVRGKLKGVPKSAAHRAAMRKPKSAAHKKALSEAAKRRYARAKMESGRGNL